MREIVHSPPMEEEEEERNRSEDESPPPTTVFLARFNLKTGLFSAFLPAENLLSFGKVLTS